MGVGGATLGGAGKTPVVLELARVFGATERVVVLASAYSARVSQPLRVLPEHPAREVGDEGAWLARALAPHGVPVVVGRNRQQLVDWASRLGDVLLVDGLLQAAPEPLSASLLVLDAGAPFGAGHCPPAGDLRASPGRCLALADRVLTLVGPAQTVPALGHPVDVVRHGWSGVRTQDGLRLPVKSLRGLALGLLLAIARPERVLRALQQTGIEPRRVELHTDHGEFPAPRRGPPVDAWLTTQKCATKLGRQYGGAPVWALDHAVELPTPLVAWLGERLGRTP